MVIQDTVLEFHNYVFPKYIDNYKKYLWFVAERLWKIDSWQSNISYPMVSAAVDTMFWNIFDFWYEFWINEAKLKALCTQAFDFRWTGKKVFGQVAKEILICWKWYVKDYFVKEDHKDTYFWQELKTEIKTPSMYYISIFDVLYDRSKWLTDSPFKVIRTFTTWDSIKAKVLPLLLEGKDPKLKKSITKKLDLLLKKYKDDHSSRFSTYDYNPVKALTATGHWLAWEKSTEYYSLTNCKTKKWLVWNDGTSMNEKENNYFLNSKKSTFELIEYNTNTEKYIFINWNIIYFGPKTHNLWDIREASNSIISWTGNANWVSDKLWGLQDIQNTLWNAFIDNIKLNLWPMFKISWNIPAWKNGTLDFKSFKAFRSNGWADIEKIQLWVSDFAPLNFMQMVEWAGQKESWMWNYISWGTWSIERTSTWVDMKFNQYKSKLTPITDSIDQMMWNIARSWVKMYMQFFSIEELWEKWVNVVKEYKKDDKEKEVFNTFMVNKVDIRDILDENNITFTYNSLEKITKEWSRTTITTNLQYLVQYMPNKLNMDEIAKVLWGQDFDPAKLFKEETEQAPEQNEWDPFQWALPEWGWGYPPKEEYTPEPKWLAGGQWEEVSPQETTPEELLSKLQWIV
jgi:hypothetical protein